MSTLKIYDISTCYACVCVPKGLKKQGVEELMNQTAPLPGKHHWYIADENFADDLPNPCPCKSQGDLTKHGIDRVHYLLTNSQVKMKELFREGCYVEN